MKNFILSSLVLSSLSFAVSAETIVCKRVIEVEGARGFVYQMAPRVPTRVTRMSFNTTTKEVTFTRQKMNGRLALGKSPYKLMPPDEEFDGNSLDFTTERGVARLNFAEKSLGRFAGSRTKYIIGEFFEMDLDSTSWSYLCPLKFKKEIE